MYLFQLLLLNNSEQYLKQQMSRSCSNQILYSNRLLHKGPIASTSNLQHILISAK